MDVHVAQLMWVGSSSRGLACGIAGELCCLMMWRLRMLGSTTTSTRNPWISCWFRHTRTSRVAEDVVPQELYGLQLRCSAGDAGQLGLGELFEQWRSWLRCVGPHELLPIFLEPRHFPRAPRGRPWPAWGREGARAHRALCGWLESQDARVQHLGTACTECGDPTRRVCWACCVGMCSDCYTWRQPCTVCGGRKKMFAEG